jgi:hypothetical protein
MTGIELINEEQVRQRQVEGWTNEHDDTHSNGELAKAASVYSHPNPSCNFISEVWPFYMKWYKPSGIRFSDDDPQTYDGRIRELQKAGALIASEIDRINRKKQTHENTKV